MREPNSGSRELFDQFILRDEKLPEPKRPWQFELYSNSMAGPYNRVTSNERGLGYSVYYYERFMALSPLTRTIAIDGVEPTAETIASGKYPMATPVYAAIRADEAADAPAAKLLNWLLSDEGQAVVRESGYVPVTRP
jgi:phosphate transport system substrate-binding protein